MIEIHWAWLVIAYLWVTLSAGYAVRTYHRDESLFKHWMVALVLFPIVPIVMVFDALFGTEIS